MRVLSYVMLILALALAAVLLIGLGWTAAHVDWSHKVFMAAFWTEKPEDVRNAVLVFGGVVAAALGLALAAARTHAADLQARAANEQARVANTQARIAEQGHITDRFTKAIEQLGSGKLEVRLGAIYALERIARDSKRDHGPIMETLTAYVREKAPWPPRLVDSSIEAPWKPDDKMEVSEEGVVKLPVDIRAVLAVIAQRRREHDVEGQQLDLRGTDLRGADLVRASLEKLFFMEANLERAAFMEAHLEGTVFLRAHLEGAYLTQAHLEGANLDMAHLGRAVLQKAHLEGASLQLSFCRRASFTEAHLERASLMQAHLEEADLEGARLDGANLKGAHLQGANLKRAWLEGANLTGARLEGADLSWARGLTQKQLDSAYSDAETKLPEGLTVKNRRPLWQGHHRGAST